MGETSSKNTEAGKQAAENQFHRSDFEHREEMDSKYDNRFGEISFVDSYGGNADSIMKKRLKFKAARGFATAGKNKKQRLNFDHRYFAKLYDYDAGYVESSTIGLFSDDESVFQISCYFDYFANDLEQEMQTRIDDGYQFNGDELYQMARTMITANYYLQTNKMKHGDIRPCFILLNSSNDYRLIENLRDLPGRGPATALMAETTIYCSPVVYENLRKNVTKFDHDKSRSDVFSLGLCILEAGLGHSIQDIYNHDKGKFNETILQDH